MLQNCSPRLQIEIISIGWADKTDYFLMPIYLQYYFWLVFISLGCLLLERLKPWRPKQEVIRKGFVQDLFWLVFNQQYVGWMLALGVVKLVSLFDDSLVGIGLPAISEFQLIADWPLYWQFLLAFVLKDFIEWNVHRLLHTVPWMWEFHKLHHSIEDMDWLGAFRSHWGEHVIHRMVSFIPLVILGTNSVALFVIAVAGTLIQEISHANLRQDWGVFRYVINSPRFHSWHHDVKMYGKGGQNFAVNLAIWDWLFGTAYWPEDAEQPKRFGFSGMKRYPENLIGRLLHPFIKFKK